MPTKPDHHCFLVKGRIKPENLVAIEKLGVELGVTEFTSTIYADTANQAQTAIVEAYGGEDRVTVDDVESCPHQKT